ncbi:PAS domain S-box protein [Crenalkalicoccus roseus]|uniref:PAS domain S-box protein n=1 Tax=Crenalkalicoccus roseus TaxID=1485588 RepID=UPI00108056A9|nr:PAS domain S-box protein [Crenalkalicoccus roseus]
MAWPTLSLRQLLAAAFGGVALLAALAASLLAGEEAGERLEARIRQGLLADARQAAAQLDREMFGRWRDLQVAAALPLMRSPETPAEVRRAILRQLHDTYDHYALLAFLAPDGRVLADSSQRLEGTDALGRTLLLLRQAARAPVASLQGGAGEEAPGRVGLAAPVFGRGGELVGVIAAHLDRHWAEAILGASAPGEPERMILCREGEVLLGPPGLIGRRLPLPPAGGVTEFPDGGRYLAAAAATSGHRDYPGLGWVVLTRQDAEAALGEVRATRRDILLHGLVAAGIAAVLGWLAAAWLALPLRRLAGAASRLQADPGAPPLPREAGYAEATALARAFDALLADRSRGETALRESEERLRLAQQAGQIGTYEWDIRRDTARLTRGFALLHGMPEAPEEQAWEDAYATWLGMLVEEDRPRIAAELAAALASPGPYALEYRIRLPDGGTRWLADRGEVFAGPDGRAARALGAVRDVTARREAEAALLRAKQELEARVAARTAELARSEAELRRIYDRTPAAFHSVDAEGRLIRVSEQWLAFLGYRPEEVLGRSPSAFMAPDSAARWEAALAELRESADEVRSYEYRMLRRDGRAVEVLLRARAERDGAGRFLRSYAVLFDLTERNRTEARLREAQKLEALGRIAGGVAHDFNNLLQVVTGALRLMLARPDDPARIRRYAEAALQAAERGAGVTRRMLAFAGQERLEARPVPLGEVLEEMRALLRGPLGPGIAVEVAVPPGLPPAQADRTMLERVLTGLALNARDAMPEGGRLRLEAGAETVGPGDPRGLAPGRYLRLSVRDSGTGMDEATRARATEPFFTTKDVGQGSGLGLSMAHGFAAQSGGALQIESRPGRGTAVHLWLPAAPAGAPAGVEAGRGASVLLVEDEAEVRAVLAATLREAGFRVTEAAEAAGALALLERPDGFDAVVTDHAMPGMSGVSLAARLAARGKGPPVLVLTGTDTGPEFRALPEGVGVLRKPVEPAALLAWLGATVRRG